MDACKDAIKAFDSLIDWLSTRPTHAFGFATSVDAADRNHRRYGQELRSRTQRMTSALIHLATDNVPVPNDYTWRRLWEVLNVGCVFTLGPNFRYDETQQREFREVAIAARDEFKKSIDPTLSRLSNVEITDQEYESVLAILRSWQEHVERQPSGFRSLCEESIRDLCLITLNTHFNGRASAETKNRHGKTDILITMPSQGVFIAECKIWHGAADLRAAINQLLGYLTWRERKAAVIVFNRTRNRSRVVRTIATVAEENELHTARINHIHASESRHSFRHPDDTDLIHIVTFITVDIPPLTS